MTLLDRLRRALDEEDRRHREWWLACARRREARKRARVFAWEAFCGMHRMLPPAQFQACLAGEPLLFPAEWHPTGSPDSASPPSRS